MNHSATAVIQIEDLLKTVGAFDEPQSQLFGTILALRKGRYKPRAQDPFRELKVTWSFHQFDFSSQSTILSKQGPAA